jgi:coenzyme PQQ biosynthesis protein PqqD
MISVSERPRLSAKASLRFDRRTGRYLLLYPEAGLDLNRTASEIIRLCTREYSVEEIVRNLSLHHPDASVVEIERDVNNFLSALAARGLLRGQP